jgi:hypothetical protein
VTLGFPQSPVKFSKFGSQQNGSQQQTSHQPKRNQTASLQVKCQQQTPYFQLEHFGRSITVGLCTWSCVGFTKFSSKVRFTAWFQKKKTILLDIKNNNLIINGY